ncbi:MAG: hypothetical protein ACKESB_02595 [Candidatus Hodgkinia cicadicola]
MKLSYLPQQQRAEGKKGVDGREVGGEEVEKKKVVGTAVAAIWGWHDSGFEAKADVFEGPGEDVQICCTEDDYDKRARWLWCDQAGSCEVEDGRLPPVVACVKGVKTQRFNRPTVGLMMVEDWAAEVLPWVPTACLEVSNRRDVLY